MRINPAMQAILGNLEKTIEGMPDNRSDEALLKAERDRIEALEMGLDRPLFSGPQTRKENPQIPEKILPGISLCMIVKNEAKNIHQCLLDAEKFADEIIIVDTGSTDATMSLVATHCKVRLFDFPWRNDFSKARNYGLQFASREWIVWLDADDRVTEQMAARIKMIAMVPAANPQEAYSFQIENTSEEGAVTLAFQQLRMVPRARGIVTPRFKDAVHEQLWSYVTENAIGVVPHADISIQHTGYQTEEMIAVKRKRNRAILFSSPDSPRRDYFLGLDESNTGDSYSALAYFLHTLTAFKGLTDTLRSRFLFLIGLQFERLGSYELALSWYGQSADQDAVFRTAECHERMGNILEAKRNYEKYWVDDTIPSFYGDLSASYKPQALKRLKEISFNECEYWKEQK